MDGSVDRDRSQPCGNETIGDQPLPGSDLVTAASMPQQDERPCVPGPPPQNGWHPSGTDRHGERGRLDRIHGARRYPCPPVRARDALIDSVDSFMAPVDLVSDEFMSQTYSQTIDELHSMQGRIRQIRASTCEPRNNSNPRYHALSMAVSSLGKAADDMQDEDALTP